ncbi:MAG: purine-nucleoside phosphorylase [candidate division KSB1 bacterium]
MTHPIAVPAFPRLDAGFLAQALVSARARAPFLPRLALLLDSGLEFFAEQLQNAQMISAAEFFGEACSTAPAHWIFGELGGKKILAVPGCSSAYENYSVPRIGFMLHLIAELGVQRLIVLNAARGINPQFAPGDLMLIDDHLNMMFVNPLRGQHRKAWGERWPDMSAPYAPVLQKIALHLATAARLPLRRGVLYAVRGPSHETVAEIPMARRAGADAVTMSGVPEVLVALSRRMQVLGLSCLTSMSAGLNPHKREDAERAESANRSRATLTQLLQRLIKRIG